MCFAAKCLVLFRVRRSDRRPDLTHSTAPLAARLPLDEDGLEESMPQPLAVHLGHESPHQSYCAPTRSVSKLKRRLKKWFTPGE